MQYLITTNRLRLRQFDLRDAESVYLLNNDPEVIKYTGDPPFKDVDEAAQFIANYDAYKKYGYGRWTVEIISTGEFIGWCGLKYDVENRVADLGFRFYREQWGKGFATEAARACINYGFTQLKLDTIIGRAMKENIASIKVLEKCGMLLVGDFDCAKHPGVMYKIHQTEWQDRYAL